MNVIELTTFSRHIPVSIHQIPGPPSHGLRRRAQQQKISTPKFHIIRGTHEHTKTPNNNRECQPANEPFEIQ